MISKPFSSSRAKQVADYLQSLIHEQIYQPGDKLPPLHEMAEILQVSKSTIREALAALVAQDLIDVKHGKGYFVRVDFSEMDEAVNAKNLSEVLFARIVLEVPAAGLAALHRQTEHLHRLQACLADMDSEGTEQRVRADLNFHTVMAEATGNTVIEGLIKSLAPMMGKTMKFSRTIAGSEGDVRQKHWDLYKTIEAQNGAMSRYLMFQHLRDTAIRLEKLLPDSFSTVLEHETVFGYLPNEEKRPRDL